MLLAPALVVTVLLFGGGLVLAVLQSFSLQATETGLAVPTGPGLDAYRAVFAQPTFLRSATVSLWIAAVSTALATVLGIAAALTLRRSFAGQRTALFLFHLNLTVPHVLGAVGILFLFAQSGLLARLAFAAGLIDQPSEFPALVHDRAGIGIILHYVWKEVPFIGLIALANLQAIGTDMESAARALGASRWQAVRHVLLPAILPGVLAASVLVFAFTFGAYEVPALLGPNAPAVLPVLAWRSYTDVDLAARPEAMAMAVVVALLSVGLIVAYRWLARRAFRA